MAAAAWPAAGQRPPRYHFIRDDGLPRAAMTAGPAFGFTRLHHVQLAIPPGGEDKSRDFWSATIGLDELPKPPALAARGGCWFAGGGLEVHLGAEPEFTPARRAHPGIEVTGLSELAARLESAGVSVKWDNEMPGYDRFYSADPFGNRLEFLQRRAG